MRLIPDDRTVAAMDLLVPKVGELIGGSQRRATASESRNIALLLFSMHAVMCERDFLDGAL